MVQRHSWRNYLYFLPIGIFIVFIYLYPLLYAMVLAFMQKSLLKPHLDGFIGLGNFKRLFFEEPLFWLSLKNGLIFTFFSVVFEYLLGLIVAITLNSRFARMKSTAKALLMLPWAVPIAINSMMWKFLLAPNFGFLGQVLAALGMSSMIHMNWLGSVETVMPIVIAINVWRSFPFYTITLTAGLSSIPKELYEAAEVDGANGWQRFCKVTLPGIKDTSMVIVVFHIIWTFINFDVIYLLTAGGPLNATEVLPTLLYRQAFSYFDMGYASSIGLFIFVILMIFVAPLYTRFIIRGE